MSRQIKTKQFLKTFKHYEKIHFANNNFKNALIDRIFRKLLLSQRKK